MSHRGVAVSAVVPTFRRLDTLRRCLTGLRISDHPFSEIIVVVRPTDDPETFSWITSQLAIAPELKILTIHEPGQVAALNLGLEAANGEFIAFFDDDVLPHADWLRHTLACMQDQSLAAVGGRDRILLNGQPMEGMAKRPGERNRFGVLRGEHHLAYGPPRYVASIKGCNFLVRRSALGSLRFDSRLLGTGAQYRNETWLCTNLIRANWKILLAPFIEVEHYQNERHDPERDRFTVTRCFIDTVNTVATDLAFASLWGKTKYGLYFIVVGNRCCPGLYYLLHALMKRPWAIGPMIRGGWSGYFAGLKLAKILRRAPPGEATQRTANSRAGSA